MNTDLTQEIFYIYHLNEEGAPVYLTEPNFLEGQIVGWDLTEDPGKAYGFCEFVDASSRAYEMNFYSTDLSEAFGEDEQITWLVRPCKLYLEPL